MILQSVLNWQCAVVERMWTNLSSNFSFITHWLCAFELQSSVFSKQKQNKITSKKRASNPTPAPHKARKKSPKTSKGDDSNYICLSTLGELKERK